MLQIGKEKSEDVEIHFSLKTNRTYFYKWMRKIINAKKDVTRLQSLTGKKRMNRIASGPMMMLLVISIVLLGFRVQLTTSNQSDVSLVGFRVDLQNHGLPITETLSLATGILNDYNGSNQRWSDIAENNYTEAYRNTFKYSQPNVTVTYEPLDSNFTGTFNAAGLKPNFAYQLKLMGKPSEDPVSDQHLRDIGRSYDIALNQSVGYVVFDCVVTDRNGSAYKKFSLANSYHVLWKVSQRTPQENDSTPTWHTVEGDPSDSPHAYETSVGPTDVGTYAQWEKGEPGNVKLSTGSYHVKFIITEESFHSQQSDPIGGYWSTVMGCDVNFTIDCTPPASMKGMTINAWSAEAYNSSDFDQTIANLADISTNWVTFTVFWFMNTSYVAEMQPRPDLYTASDSSLIHAIQKAHGLRMKVALKPMVDVVDGTWRGQISPSNWTLWFANYRSFINHYANFSKVNSVELFVIGTELKTSQPYESEWRQVISGVRTLFSGNVTYAANWDSYDTSSLKFWDALDYVGVDAYFPLTNSYNPTVQQLINAWSFNYYGRNWTNELYSTCKQTNKTMIFAEIGYCSQNGTNTQPWNWTFSPTVDLQEQADCYQAALEVFEDKTWFKGWFWWDWETNPNAGGPIDIYYTPQNKPAQNILNQYYSTRMLTFQATGANVPITVSYTTVTGNRTREWSLTIPVGASNSATIPYGSNVSFTYASPVAGDNGVRYVWVSANASSPLINVVNDTTVIGQYTTQYSVTFSQSGIDFDLTGAVVTIDGTGYSVSALTTSFWLDSGSSHTFAFNSPLLVTANAKQYVWTGTTGLSTLQSGSIIVSGSGSVTGNYKTQCYLTVTSANDSPTPASGWFDSGIRITASVTSPWLGEAGTRYLCTGWNGTGSVPTSGTIRNTTFIITQPSSIAWNWKTQYILIVMTDPNVLSPQPTRDPMAEAGSANGWWYDASTNVTLTAQTVTGYAFSYWNIDGTSQGSEVDRITVTINAPHTSTAYYTICVSSDVGGGGGRMPYMN